MSDVLKKLIIKQTKLKAELKEVTEKIKLKTLLGYRVCIYGDEYSNNQYSAIYLIKELGKKEARARACASLSQANSDGCLEEIHDKYESPTS